MSELNPKLVGAEVRRVEDPRFLTGRSCYVDDVRLPGVGHIAFVRSPHAHARILSCDVRDAAAQPGVWAVFTGADLRDSYRPIRGDSTYPGFRGTDMPLLAVDRARYVGEAVAVVVAKDRYTAEDAAERVRVEYEPLPAVVDVEAALRPDSPLVYEEWGENLFLRREVAAGDVDAAFAQADRVWRGTFRTRRQAGMPMETRGYAADYDPRTGSVTLWAASQMPHVERTGIADALGIPESRLRVIAPDVGGGFGVKGNLYPEEVLVCLLALRLRRPVKWIEDRREHLLCCNHARDHIHHVEAAVKSDGTLLGLKVTVIVDSGAYSVYPWTAAMEAGMAMGVIPGPYRIRNYHAVGLTVATNKCPLGPYRGVARPSACFTIERTMDEVARLLGLDPADVRRKNFVQPGEFPYTSVTGLIYDSGSYVESLDRACEALDYGALRDEQRRLRKEGRYIGVGFASYMEQTAHGTTEFAKRGLPIVPGFDSVHMRIEPSGDVLVMAGIQSHGQGLETTLAQVAADELGVPLERVRVLHGDTAVSPYGMGTFASRSAVMAGGATTLAARELRAKMIRVAAHLLEISPDDVACADGFFSAKGLPSRRLSFDEVARLCYHRPERLPEGVAPGLDVTQRYGAEPGTGTFANSTHAAVVEVDPETGAVELLRYVVVEDCGRMIDPMLVEGQVHGGVVQGLGTALWEELAYDETGQLLTTTLMDYLMPASVEVPAIEVHHLETPSPFTLGGFKGMGEGGAIAPGAAVANAVADALSPFGVWIGGIPLSPERVRAALVATGRTEGDARSA